MQSLFCVREGSGTVSTDNAQATTSKLNFRENKDFWRFLWS